MTFRDQVRCALVDRADWVYQTLSAATEADLPLHEDTVTQMVLLDLQTRFPSGLTVRAFTRSEESRNGADWEWWWQGETRWFGCRVQAKRLKLLTRSKLGYDLGYKPKREGSDLQVDLLLAAAGAARIPAVYALYNSSDLDLDDVPWRCGGWPKRPQLMGVGLLPAEIAKDRVALAALDQTSVNQYAVPWACLARCSGACHRWPTAQFQPEDLGLPRDTGRDDLAFNAAAAMGTCLQWWKLGKFRQQASNTYDLNGVVQGLREELPGYVRAIIGTATTGSAELPADDEASGISIPDEVAENLAGVVIVGNDR